MFVCMYACMYAFMYAREPQAAYPRANHAFIHTCTHAYIHSGVTLSLPAAGLDLLQERSAACPSAGSSPCLASLITHQNVYKGGTSAISCLKQICRMWSRMRSMSWLMTDICDVTSVSVYGQDIICKSTFRESMSYMWICKHAAWWWWLLRMWLAKCMCTKSKAWQKNMRLYVVLM